MLTKNRQLTRIERLEHGKHIPNVTTSRGNRTNGQQTIPFTMPSERNL